MLSRQTLALLVALAAPALVTAQEREWVEDYTGSWNDDAGAPPAEVQVEVDAAPPPNFDTFHGELTPYGAWVSTGRYGRVWRPHVAADWRPYYYGRWEWTNEGWLWVSDEPFGWAVYHYGRWAYDTGYGWIWVPGYQWAPAWVTWRTSGDVIGWAPLAPGFSLYVSTYPYVDYHWTFVPCVQFVSYPVYRHAYPPHYARQYYGRTAPAPARPAPRPGMGSQPAPRPAWGGPSPRSIEQRVGRAVSPVRIVSAPNPNAASRPGEVSLYRPGRVAPGTRASAAASRATRPSWSGGAPASGGRSAQGYAPAPAARSEQGSRAAPAAQPQPRPQRSSSDDRPAAQPQRSSSGDRPAVQPSPRSSGGGESRGTSGNGGGSRGGGGGGSGSRPAPSPGGRGR